MKQHNIDRAKILIIDDDEGVCQLVALSLSLIGAIPFTAETGKGGLRTFYEKKPDLVILDINLPDISGWEVCSQIRVMSDIPIIMLTTLNRDQDVVEGFAQGADDFISKPFSTEVLISRISAVLRRVKAQQGQSRTKFNDGFLSVDIESRQVIVDGEECKLSDTEFRLLAYLFGNANRILTYGQILEHVWGWEYKDSTEYVHVYISQLRKKLKETDDPRYLQTEYGVGYRFSTNVLPSE